MIRVLVISYSQTGQLAAAVRSLVSGLDPGRFVVTFETIRPRTDYPFPWSYWKFFEVLPDCVLGRAPGVEPLLAARDTPFDLVIIAYSVWFLAPSLPIQGFFASDDARLLRGARVITLVVCRNMWHTASERMKALVSQAGGILIDNVVVTDPSPPLASFVTTPRWMFTGKRDAFWGFPPAGVPDSDLASLSRFGSALSTRPGMLESPPGASLLGGLGAAAVVHRQVIPELIGRFSFPLWARLMDLAGRPGSVGRRLSTSLFTLYLVFAVLVLVPAAVIAGFVLRPMLRTRLRAYIAKLEAPSGGWAGAENHPLAADGALRGTGRAA